MKRQQTLNNTGNAGSFMALHYSMFSVEALKTNDVLVYSHMANDYLFFLSERGQYQPSEQLIADRLGLGLNTVKRSIKTLEKQGYLKPISRKKGCCTVWHVEKVDEDGLPLISEPKITQRTEIMTRGEVKATIIPEPVIPTFSPFPHPTDETPY